MKLLDLAKAIVAHGSDVKVIAPKDEANGVYHFCDANNTTVNIPSDVEYDSQLHDLVIKTLSYMNVSSVVNFAFNKLLQGSYLVGYETVVDVDNYSSSMLCLLKFKRDGCDIVQHFVRIVVSVEDGNVEVQRKINRVDALDYIIDDASQLERTVLNALTAITINH